MGWYPTSLFRPPGPQETLRKLEEGSKLLSAGYFSKPQAFPKVTAPSIVYMWLPEAGKWAASTPEERVKVKVTQDVALQTGARTETAGT